MTIKTILQSYQRALALFVFSFLVTAIFSTSLKVFFTHQSWREVLTKGLLIPCFTWVMQFLLTLFLLSAERRVTYWTTLGIVCLIGSIALLPAACYNFLANHPAPLVSVINVVASIILMAITLHLRLQQAGFSWQWILSWLLLISMNMTLYWLLIH